MQQLVASLYSNFLTKNILVVRGPMQTINNVNIKIIQEIQFHEPVHSLDASMSTQRNTDEATRLISDHVLLGHCKAFKTCSALQTSE
jgi:hypothetical protein